VALASISVRGFRNLEPTIVGFAAGSNYLFGPNGAGKTNLLEAIHYLATGRSFRRCPDADLLGFGRDVLIVSGTDESGATAEIRFDGREKRLLRNNIPVEKLSEYFGWLPVVVLLLEDIELVRGAPGIRRGFLDMALAKAEGGVAGRPKSEGRSQNVEGRSEEQSYIALTGAYRRAVGQYNRLLERSAVSRDPLVDQFSAWEEEVVRTGVPVYEARMDKMAGLLENAAKHYARLAGHGAVFSYRSSVGESSDLAGAFRQRLAATRERARMLRHALVGPHRDDMRIARGDRELRKFGSVGEQRLAGIALRLAEADMILSAGRQRPVFLLDEVASELDEDRSRMVLEMVAERGQMVYAAARRTVRPEVKSQSAKGKMQNGRGEGGREQGIEGSSEEPQSTARDAAPSLDHLTTGPLDHFSGKEFHVEAGKVSEVS
jgi:DNA replication and repair protein RecF